MLLRSPRRMRSVARYPSNAPTLAGAVEAIPSLPSRGDLRDAAALRVAELAVLVLRGSAAAVLLSPALAVAFLLAG